MLNHTYTSVKNANLVDCGKKQHISSQPSLLLKDNFLGEFRTELDKKKVLANLGIATDLSLEWEYIKGDIGRNSALIEELDSRTKYTSKIDGFYKTVVEGIQYLETIVGGEQEGEEEQNNKLAALEQTSKELKESLVNLKTYIENTVSVNIETLQKNLNTVTEKVNNITNLIQVSTKANNALTLIPEDSENLQEGETPGLYVPDLSEEVSTATQNIEKLQENVKDILDTYVTKEELGGGDFDFVSQDDFDTYVDNAEDAISDIHEELAKTVKTGEDGHVDTLYVNKISKNNDDGNIVITDSFEVDSNIPLDIRFVVKSLDQLHSLKPQVCYAGMGVIVSDQASLYILREPIDGIIDEAYIKDEKGINWKCPEDLVIEVVTQEEYDRKLEEGSINPNMFYYIHEEIVEEPKREDYDSDESYSEALNKWLRVLQQKYMSAVWGQEIETLVSNKASSTAVKSLEMEIQRLAALIDSLSGGSSGINIKDLNDQVVQNTSDIESLIGEEGTIPSLQKDVETLNKTLTSDYVTKESITIDDPNTDYIFVKKTEFETYKTSKDQAMAAQIETEKVVTNQIVLGEGVLLKEENSVKFNDKKFAFASDVPVIEVVDSETFENKEDIDEETYYYVYDEEERYVPDSEFIEYKTSQNKAINTLTENINKNTTSIGELNNLTTDNQNTLVFAINELVSKVKNLTDELSSLKEKVNGLETI